MISGERFCMGFRAGVATGASNCQRLKPFTSQARCGTVEEASEKVAQALCLCAFCDRLLCGCAKCLEVRTGRVPVLLKSFRSRLFAQPVKPGRRGRSSVSASAKPAAARSTVQPIPPFLAILNCESSKKLRDSSDRRSTQPGVYALPGKAPALERRSKGDPPAEGV